MTRIPEVSELPEFATVEEYAAVTRQGLTKSYDDVRQKRIRSVRLGRTIRIPRTAIEELLGLEPERPALRMVK